MKKSHLIAGVAAAATLVTAASSCENEQFRDAPVGVVDDVPQFVMTNLDGFPNIAFRCLGPNGIYTTTRDYGDGLTIVTNDPVCENQEALDFAADRFTPQPGDPSEFTSEDE